MSRSQARGDATLAAACSGKTRILEGGGDEQNKPLTVKALDPFSPFISLPANIKHAGEEIRHWVRLRHSNSVAARMLLNCR